ncbi:MAG: L,D-transpeptidase family protein [Syntrophobacteraceae bacterium]
MMDRNFSLTRTLSTALFVLTLVTLGQSVVFSEAMTPDTQQVREEHRAAPPAKHSNEPTSPLWRSFLWESIPSEWLADTNRQTIMQGYEARGWLPLFITARFEVNQGAKDLLAAISDLDSHAIDPAPFRLDRVEKVIVRLENCRIALANAEADVHDSIATVGERASFDYSRPQDQPPPLQRYASNSPDVMLPDPNLKKQRERMYQEAFKAASEVDLCLAETLVRFAREMDAHSGEKQVRALQGATSMRDFIQELVPTAPRYRTLHEAYARYRTLAQQHPQTSGINPASLAPGQSGSAVRDLQVRLQQEGFLDGKLSGQFDSATHDALRAFQKAHGIDPDGKIGQRTKEWLTISFAQKARMIAASLKQLRQSDTRQHASFLRINIPQFTLEYVRDGKLQATHRVIVGKSSGRKIKINGRLVGENHTPPLSSAVQQIVVNPRWYINDRIWRELAGDIDEDPTFYERHGFSRAGGFYAGGAPRVFQEPGPSNPLGQVKLEFPNAYAVYVHDTPKKFLFARSRRDFSHGCVRLENARDLAEMILTDDQNAMATRFKSLFATRRTNYIKLNEPLPIVIEYVPVSTDDSGSVLFCGDPYGQLDQTPSKSS